MLFGGFVSPDKASVRGLRTDWKCPPWSGLEEPPTLVLGKYLYEGEQMGRHAYLIYFCGVPTSEFCLALRVYNYRYMYFWLFCGMMSGSFLGRSGG